MRTSDQVREHLDKLNPSRLALLEMEEPVNQIVEIENQRQTQLKAEPVLQHERSAPEKEDAMKDDKDDENHNESLEELLTRSDVKVDEDGQSNDDILSLQMKLLQSSLGASRKSNAS